MNRFDILNEKGLPPLKNAETSYDREKSVLPKIQRRSFNVNFETKKLHEITHPSRMYGMASYFEDLYGGQIAEGRFFVRASTVPINSIEVKFTVTKPKNRFELLRNSN